MPLLLPLWVVLTESLVLLSSHTITLWRCEYVCIFMQPRVFLFRRISLKHFRCPVTVVTTTCIASMRTVCAVFVWSTSTSFKTQLRLGECLCHISWLLSSSWGEWNLKLFFMWSHKDSVNKTVKSKIWSNWNNSLMWGTFLYHLLLCLSILISLCAIVADPQ